MYNINIKWKIREKFKSLKNSKLKNSKPIHSVFPKIKLSKNHFKSNFKYELYSRKKLKLKYNTLPEEYGLIQINNFINSKSCHSLSFLKENLIFNYAKEFMSGFYSRNESLEKIPLFAEFQQN